MWWTANRPGVTIRLMKLSPTDISEIEAVLERAGYADGGAAVIEALDLHKAFIEGLRSDVEASRAGGAHAADAVHAEAQAVLERRLRDRDEGR